MSAAPSIATGQIVTRLLAGVVPMTLRVSAVTDSLISCGPWTFDRETGAEVDEDLGWGAPPLRTGSYLDFSTVRDPEQQP